MDSTEQEIISLINNASAPNEAVRQPAIQLLQSYTFRLEFLPVFENILPTFVINQQITSTYFCLLILRDLINNRGALLARNQHHEHINNLLLIAREHAPLIAQDYAVRNVFSDAISISYRFIYEYSINQDFDFQSLSEFLTISEPHIIFAMNTFISLLDSIQKPMRHCPNNWQTIVEDSFYNLKIGCFVDISLGSILIDNKIINELGIDLLIKSLKFRKGSKKPPTDLLKHFAMSENFEYLNKIIFFIQSWEPQESIKALEALSCLFKCAIKFQDSGKFVKNWIQFLLTNIIQILKSATNQKGVVVFLVEFTEERITGKYDFDFFNKFVVELFGYTQNNFQTDPKSFMIIWNQIYNNMFEQLIVVQSPKKEANKPKYNNRNNKKMTGIIPEKNALYAMAFNPSDSKKKENIPQIVESEEGTKNAAVKPEEEFCHMLLMIFENHFNNLMENNENIIETYFGYFDEFVKDYTNLWSLVTPRAVHASNCLLREVTEVIIAGEINVNSYNKIIIITMLVDSALQSRLLFKKEEESDYIRFLENCLSSVLAFLRVEENNFPQLLANNGEIVAKAEFRFIDLASTLFKASKFLSGKNFSTLKQALNKLEQEYGKIDDILMNHFLYDLNVFGSLPLLLFKIVEFFNEMSQNISISVSMTVKNNQILKDLARRKKEINFFNNFSFNDLNKMIPSIYKMYSKTFEENEFPLFLSFFDQMFNSADGFLDRPENCFILYRQIRGVLGDYSANIEQIIFKWAISHFTDTMNCLQKHCHTKYVVEAIVKMWLHLKMRNFCPEMSGNGIDYFHMNTQILLFLQGNCEESQWLSIKLIHNCIVGDYANYGIMQLYGDNSVQVILDGLYILIESWANGETPKRLERINEILVKIVEIGKVNTIFDIEKNFCAVNEFLIQNLLLRHVDIWKSTCNVIEAMTNEAVKKSFPLNRFCQFFILILDGLISNLFEDDALKKATAGAIFQLLDKEKGPMNSICQEVINTFEANYLEEVKSIFSKFLQSTNNDHSKISSSYQGSDFKKYVTEVYNFSVSMKKFHVEMANIPKFAQFFRRTESQTVI